MGVRKIKIDMFNECLRVYMPEELGKFCRDYDIEIKDDYAGCCCGNGVWIGQPEVWIVAHEVSHFVDWLVEGELRLETTLAKSTEVRAYLVGWLTGKIWAMFQ